MYKHPILQYIRLYHKVIGKFRLYNRETGSLYVKKSYDLNRKTDSAQMKRLNVKKLLNVEHKKNLRDCLYLLDKAQDL